MAEQWFNEGKVMKIGPLYPSMNKTASPHYRVPNGQGSRYVSARKDSPMHVGTGSPIIRVDKNGHMIPITKSPGHIRTHMPSPMSNGSTTNKTFTPPSMGKAPKTVRERMDYVYDDEY
jgi:hypothetical protein